MKQQHFKTVIAGAGVSGLYTAWRLVEAGHEPAELVVLEATDRVGGRLWSEKLHEETALPAELGGMFFNDQQPLVFGLCDRVFDLAREPIVPKSDFAWLRGVRFKVEQFTDPDVLPYRLAPDEQGLAYHQLFLMAAERIAPDLKEHWPLKPDGKREDTLAYLQGLKFDGRPLYEWGFWNLLSRVLSNEAWLALRDMVSSYTLFSNWNGYNALVAFILEQAGSWYRLTHGYQELPERLARELDQAGVAIRRYHALSHIDRARGGNGLHLAIDANGTREELESERLVLALGRHALDKLVDSSPVLVGTSLSNHLEAVTGQPACKIFLTFQDPWWRNVPEGPGRIEHGTYAVSHTDLPLRQCYYLGMDDISGEGLMLASYADGQAVEFWQALMADSGRSRQLRCELSHQALEEIRIQLSKMHNVEVPRPSAGVFVNWTLPPYGGGWHNWQPGWKSWNTTAVMTRPVAELDLHVCGEAYSEAQGWVQGALESAEIMLREEFGLAAPEWLGNDDCLAAYRKSG